MTAPVLTESQIADVIQHLETADDNHRLWLSRMHTSLICGEPFDRDVFSECAHRECRFGRWYYGNDIDLLRGRPDYMALDELHRSMHDSARELARRSEAGEAIAVADYSRFIDRQQVFSERLLQLRDQLRECLFTFDSLTGVMTRDPFLKSLAGEMERMRRDGSAASVALLDIDHFKKINDEHGHLTGDRVLRVLGQYLTRQLRSYDTVCRYGGEEFMFCLPRTGPVEAVAVMDRLRENMTSLQGSGTDQLPFRVTASVGVAAVDASLSVEEIIDRADEALYAAKASGRNRVLAFGEPSPG